MTENCENIEKRLKCLVLVSFNYIQINCLSYKDNLNETNDF